VKLNYRKHNSQKLVRFVREEKQQKKADNKTLTYLNIFEILNIVFDLFLFSSFTFKLCKINLKQIFFKYNYILEIIFLFMMY